MSARTDPHRPGAILPCDYEQVAAFGMMSDGEGGHEEYGLEDVPGEDADWADIWPGLYRCDVCGARYNHGVVLHHKPTGQLITMGHDCGTKYSLALDLAGWKEWHRVASDKRARAAIEMKHATAARAWREENPEACAALELIHGTKRNEYADPVCSTHGALLEHRQYEDSPEVQERNRVADECRECSRLHQAYLRYGWHDRKNKALDVLTDMARKLVRYGSLSEKQAAYAVKLGEIVRGWQPRAEDVHVPAPEGRVAFTGTIISVKEREGYMGGVEYKMTVKVETPEGSWLAWMTHTGEGRGEKVNILATLTRGDDAHFAFGKRPVSLTDEELATYRAKEAKAAARAAKKAAKVICDQEVA